MQEIKERKPRTVISHSNAAFHSPEMKALADFIGIDLTEPGLEVHIKTSANSLTYVECLYFEDDPDALPGAKFLRPLSDRD